MKKEKDPRLMETRDSLERKKGDFQHDDEGNFRIIPVRRPSEQQVQI